MNILRQIAKWFVEKAVHAYATLLDMHFPKEFLWQWKLQYLFDTYEADTTALFKKQIKKGMTVIDVGANLGYYTRLFARLVGPEGKVYAFEADQENFVYLQKNCARFPQVEVFPHAVSSSTGTVEFFHVLGSYSTGVHSMLEAENTERRVVPSTTIDDFARERKLMIDVLKIDVEGAEPMVFKGMSETLSKKPFVVFEYTPETSKEFLNDLKSKHSLYAISKQGTLMALENLSLEMGKREYANVVLKD
jgi:FkbM family methyltransferase